MLRKTVETCIYSSELEKMKNFYINNIGLRFVSEEPGRYVFLKAGKSMFLIFNPDGTNNKNQSMFPPHGASIPPPASVHFALEIDKEDYEKAKEILIQNEIEIEKELTWENERLKSIYFRDRSGNLVEFITMGNWPVEDVII
jgi:catechol 2,3-dioxygenase-like lactoylglutathione lyase family enzyme